MARALFAGSFDPVTNGHLDIIERASALFEKLWVAVAVNSRKNPLFSLEERVAMLRAQITTRENVEVVGFRGLIASFAEEVGAAALVRGVRDSSDFTAEARLAVMNRGLVPGLESVFLMPDPRFAFVSSSLIKEIVAGGGDASAYLPEDVLVPLRERLNERGAATTGTAATGGEPA